MTYRSFGLAALVVGAIRSAVADPEQAEQVAENTRVIGEVRTAMDGMTSRLESITSNLTANGAVDEDQTATLEGIRAELADLATALAGPADDPEDNGVLAEVEPAPDAPASPAADEIAAQQTEATAAEAEQGEQQEEQQQEG